MRRARISGLRAPSTSARAFLRDSALCTQRAVRLPAAGNGGASEDGRSEITLRSAGSQVIEHLQRSDVEEIPASRTLRRRFPPAARIRKTRNRHPCDRTVPLEGGGQGRNRTTDTRIFKRIPVGLWAYESTTCSACPAPNQPIHDTFLAHPI
jgi:hypothetical protein